MRSGLLIWIVVFVLAGCGYFAPPAVSVGPCVLVVLGGGPSHERLQPPYRVRPHKFIPPGANDAEADITYTGMGWQTVHMTVTDPAGSARMDNDGIPGDEINEGGVGTSFDTPGLWRERLQDDNAGCTQEFSVEVLTPTG